MLHADQGGANRKLVHCGSTFLAGIHLTRMSARLRFSTAIFFLVVAPKARAQASASEQAGFQALILTPIAALPQTVHVPSADETPRRLTTELLYGQYRFQGNSSLFHNVGLGVRFRVLRRVSVGATV